MSDSADAAIDLGRLCLRLGRVDRITYHDDSVTPESDTDHTVMLGLLACAFADQHLPQLDLGRIAQFALAHDLVEAYAGDTPTLQITADGRAAKHAREQAAFERISREFPTLPWIAAVINAYESLESPEARYVKALDKLVPKITHVLNRCRTIHDQGMDTTELAHRYSQQLDELNSYASDFPPLFQLRLELIDQVLAIMREQEA